MPKRKVGVLGGSFNPVHTGHLAMARFTKEALLLDEILFIPANSPPHKALDEGGVSTKDRVEMLRLALEGERDFALCDIEVRRRGKSYTVDTLTELSKNNPDAKFYLIVGSDMLLYFEKWFRFREIFSLCTVVALSRKDEDKKKIKDYQKYLWTRYQAEVLVLENPVLEVSSTEIREKVRLGLSCFADVPPKVCDYISQKGLYRVTARDFGEMEKIVRRMNGDKRFAHTQGTVKAALRLARKYGADEEKTKTAALLHDLTKNVPAELQLKMCGEFDIILDDFERSEPKLLHAVTGAALAERMFSINDGEILSAIRYHTTGKEDMTLLQKIIYLADMIEETRDFPEAGELRRLAMENLDRAVCRALSLSEEHVKQSGGKLHPDTKRAREFLEAGREESGKS